MLDIWPVSGPIVRKGLWNSLSDWIGPGSFDHANRHTRWKQFFSNPNSGIARELEDEIGRVSRLWLDALQPLGRDPDSETESPFHDCFGDGKLSFGVGFPKLQKACFDDIKRLRLCYIVKRAQSFPYDDPRRMAFFARYGDTSVRQLLLGNAHPLVHMSSVEFQTAVQNSFGLPLKVLEGHIDERIRNHANCAQLTVDRYGHNLQTVTGAKGDATRTLHDTFLAALAHSLRQAGIKFLGGGRNNRSCKHVFSHLMHHFEDADESTARQLNGIIADLIVDFTSVASSAPDGSSAAESLFDLVKTLCDLKTLACGGAYKNFTASNLNDPGTFPVEKRSAKVHKDYLKSARDLDHKFHNTQPGEVGPIEAKLLEYGAKDGPNPHAVVGLVLGAFGELSTSCYSLCTAIARVNAARVLSFWEMPPKHALALCKQKILRFWGLTAQRGWARLILDRFHDLVLLPDNPSATAHDSDSVSYEHHTYFFPDCGRGAANTAGFGWRGGSGV
jgi:hypothetical protein